MDKPDIDTTDEKEADKPDISIIVEDPNKDIAVTKKANKLDISIADAEKVNEVDRADKLETNTPVIEKADATKDTDLRTDQAEVEETNGANDSDKVVEDARRPMPARQMLAQASLFSFCIVICLFFYSSELKTSVSLGILSISFSVDIFIKRDTSSSKWLRAGIYMSSFDKLTFLMRAL